ncbi:hypothetical protein DSCW_57040 [Desulfosarcina widdelii]|uniref:SEC-C domain-containing protein n=1 Tax=Desulfosarcina widdelii TaxID=947919 RepID=A0A5K7ZPA9_9BACT|nr:SEC-C domain-containing protein [Desulfosarcina widdelii]BBO78287.1 hypothetical protein DSCW_57040 [Desulfosarcina widdelii]
MSKSRNLSNRMATVLRTEKRSIVRKHFEELHQFYRELVLDETDTGLWTIRGELKLSASYNEEYIQDSFHVEILIPPDYPESVPIVWETEGRIPNGFHKYRSKALCLGPPLQVKMKFRENPTLLGFVENLLIHYLFGRCSYEKNGVVPFGEYSHERGMLDSYKEAFHLQTDIQALQMVKLIAEGKYKGHLTCPCGSGKRIRHCHGPQLIKISQFQRRSEFYEDYFTCIMEYIRGGNELPLFFRNKKLEKRLAKEYRSYLSAMNPSTMQNMGVNDHVGDKYFRKH